MKYNIFDNIFIWWPMVICAFVFMCFGINYSDHIEKMNQEVQLRPIIVQQRFEREAWLVAHDTELTYEVRKEATTIVYYLYD